mmetsp:Transcript_37048/g.103050  ORF Transcript_37048/g.103050 Transcript_37048/m.103050 type:complete len:218 (-) Transcript_37048:606-1259(-)
MQERLGRVDHLPHGHSTSARHHVRAVLRRAASHVGFYRIANLCPTSVVDHPGQLHTLRGGLDGAGVTVRLHGAREARHLLLNGPGEVHPVAGLALYQLRGARQVLLQLAGHDAILPLPLLQDVLEFRHALSAPGTFLLQAPRQLPALCKCLCKLCPLGGARRAQVALQARKLLFLRLDRLHHPLHLACQVCLVVGSALPFLDRERLPTLLALQAVGV